MRIIYGIYLYLLKSSDSFENRGLKYIIQIRVNGVRINANIKFIYWFGVSWNNVKPASPLYFAYNLGTSVIQIKKSNLHSENL